MRLGAAEDCKGFDRARIWRSTYSHHWEIPSVRAITVARTCGKLWPRQVAPRGVDFAYLVAEASVESSLNPNAKAKTSSAAGLFQFIESTWEGMVERHGAKVGLGKEAAALAKGDLPADERRRIMDLRFDPKIAARMGAEFAG